MRQRVEAQVIDDALDFIFALYVRMPMPKDRLAWVLGANKKGVEGLQCAFWHAACGLGSTHRTNDAIAEATAMIHGFASTSSGIHAKDHADLSNLLISC